MVILALSIAVIATARGLIWISDLDFWWQYPRSRSSVFVFAYGIGFAANLVGFFAAARALLSTSGLRRAVGLCGALAAVSLFLSLTTGSVRGYVRGEYQNAAGKIRPANVRYEPESRLIRLSGPLEVGSAAQFKEILDTAADVRMVDVSGPGGLVWEARWISQMIDERRLDTMVSTECHSACVAIFAAGKRRLMYAKAVVGLHSARTLTGGVAHAENKAFNARLHSAGVEPRFLMVGSDTAPDDIWINTARQAYIAGLATDVIGP